jgi:hypothetical protein
MRVGHRFTSGTPAGKRGEDLFDLDFESGGVSNRDLPDFVPVDAELNVRDDVSHGHDRFPRHLRIVDSDLRRES